MFISGKLKSLNTDEVKASWKNLENNLQNGNISYIDIDDLFNELTLLQKRLPVEHKQLMQC